MSLRPGTYGQASPEFEAVFQEILIGNHNRSFFRDVLRTYSTGNLVLLRQKGRHSAFLLCKIPTTAHSNEQIRSAR